MIIECPACSKKFNIDEKLIPEEGRLLKCGNCEHTWFYKNEESIKLDAEINKIKAFLIESAIYLIDDNNLRKMLKKI